MANTNAVSILSHNRSLLLHNSRLPIMYLVININIISIEYYVFLLKNCGKIPLICIDFNIIFIGYLLIYFGNVVGFSGSSTRKSTGQSGKYQKLELFSTPANISDYYNLHYTDHLEFCCPC